MKDNQELIEDILALKSDLFTTPNNLEDLLSDFRQDKALAAIVMHRAINYVAQHILDKVKADNRFPYYVTLDRKFSRHSPAYTYRITLRDSETNEVIKTFNFREDDNLWDTLPTSPQQL